jgi:hypothetical protein
MTTTTSPWLYSRTRDLFILAAPAMVTLVALGMAMRAGDTMSRSYAGWLAQFALGNSTHVILTFLLLGMRRDVLRATPGQATTVIVGSTATFIISFVFFWWTHRVAPHYEDFATAVVLVFATHHSLSQAKGIWALYGMRASKSGLAAPSDLERRMMRNFVAIALLLILIRWFFIPKGPGRMYPFIQPIPGEPAFLPYSATWVLVAIWIVVAALAIGSVVRPKTRSVPKVIYVTVHMIGAGLMIGAPGWGAILTAGIHGLEYYFLCGRMIASVTEAERPSRSWVLPAMAFSMLPLVAIGLVNAPFTPQFAGDGHNQTFQSLRFFLNSIVMAHYFADAFIYRFRIPDVRRVALQRLGFAA